jgi:UDP-N-acetylmuramate dehydrogenase
MNMEEHVALARYVAWRIGGPARYLATAGSADDLAELVQWGHARELPIFVLGGGTNILISDAGFPGLVIRNRATGTRLEEHGDETTLYVESGAPMAGTARRMAGQGLGGLIWAEGLPGTVGGAVYGNAGCYGGDMAGTLVAATMLLPDGTIDEWSQAQLQFGYRSSALKAAALAAREGRQAGELHPGVGFPVVLSARLRLERDDPAKLAAAMAATASSRRSKTPSGSSCGSSFKNPPGTTAGLLLDQAGCKNMRNGGAQVSDVHANYIVNTGGATAGDVLRLTERMRERVLQMFGIELELEVQLVVA